LAHPLNQPRIDAARERVTEGYTIIQPRISTSLADTSSTRFASLFAAPVGVDPYTHVVSDVYQDVFSEGSYLGKGIYDVGTFHRLLSGRFPDSTLLSHDLLEGAYARVGLATDVELFDSFPATYF